MQQQPETPSLDAERIRLLRAQYARVAGDAVGFAAGFYARLFAIAPLTRALFRKHMDAQGDRFMRMLGRLIDEADQPAALAATIAQLAEMHRHVGLVVQDVEPVLDALCGELADRLDGEFDDTARAAWTALYRRAVAPMFTGAGLVDAELDAV
jgi:nitric oxide dioxygenase